MAWRDNLRPASFRGVKFNVDGSTLDIGRRTVKHEYPQRDIPFPEDMGRRAREYKVEAFVLADPASGNDYMAIRDALMEAIETEGAGQLVHPYHGTVQVTVFGAVPVVETTREGGMAKFSILFLEAGKQIEPATSTDTEAALSNQQNVCDASFVQDFTDDFSVDGAADFVVADALGNTEDFLDLPEVDLGDLSWIRADPLSTLTGLLPENLLSSLAAPFALATGVLALIRKVGDLSSLFDFGSDLSSSASDIDAITPSRIAQVSNQTAFSNLIVQGATANRIVAVATTVPKTIEEAQALRSEIIQRSDAVLFLDGVSQSSTAAMVQLRTDALQHLASNTVDVPSLVSIKRPVVLPAIVLAHDFYGDTWQTQGRDVDLVARNSIKHPGFVPAGQSIQYVAES